MRYTIRPISDRTWIGTMGKEPTRFSAKWTNTIELLGREVDYLKGRNVVLEIDVTETDLKLNGELRANARPTSPAVGLAFESKHGALFYRCDRFYSSWSHQGPDWQHNVRAIALTLEALRATDRYGATETGQQYTGFKALPAGTAMPPSHMTSDVATELLRGYGQPGDDLESCLRFARSQTHPDKPTGDREQWDRVETAGRALGLIR